MSGGVEKLPSGDYEVVVQGKRVTFRTECGARRAAKMDLAHALTLHHSESRLHTGDGPDPDTIGWKAVNNLPYTPEEAAWLAQRLKSKVYVPNRESSVSSMSVFAESAARTFYVLWWANREEERGHRLGSVELMDVAPPTPQAALAFGRKFIRAVEKVNGKSIDELYEIAANADGKHYKEPSRSDFGHYLAMQAEGTGVSWWDDHPEAPIKVPSANYYGSGQGEIDARFISNTSRRR